MCESPEIEYVARNELHRQPARKRQGLVPDFTAYLRPATDGPLRDVLLDVKTLHYGASTYPPSEERCHAVARRAAAVNSEYLHKARALDRQLLGVQNGATGPVEQKLRSFGHVRGLVFGSWGEGSADITWLLHQIAEWGSVHGCHLGAHRDTDVVRGILIGALQRRWGILAARANAQLLLDRLAFVGRGAGAASSRRAAASAAYFAATRSRRW